MLRSKLIQKNIQCKFMIVLSLLEISQTTVYSTQVIVRSCDIYMLRSKLFQKNIQCTSIVVLRSKLPLHLCVIPAKR